MLNWHQNEKKTSSTSTCNVFRLQPLTKNYKLKLYSSSPSLGFIDLPNFSETFDRFAAGWFFQMVHLLQSRIRVSGHVPWESVRIRYVQKQMKLQNWNGWSDKWNYENWAWKTWTPSQFSRRRVLKDTVPASTLKRSLLEINCGRSQITVGN
jgi:hypothetical protein